MYTSTDHSRFYTIKRDDMAMALNGYTYSGHEVYVLDNVAPGTAPFYRYFSPTLNDHFYTTVRNDAGYAYFSYRFKVNEGHIFTAPTTGTQPLYQYFNPILKKHSYILGYFPQGAYGYTYEQVAGYIYRAP